METAEKKSRAEQIADIKDVDEQIYASRLMLFGYIKSKKLDCYAWLMALPEEGQEHAATLTDLAAAMSQEVGLVTLSRDRVAKPN